MRLIETLCSLVLVAAFLGIGSSAVRPMRRLYAKTQEKIRTVERDRFIADGFCALCASGDERFEAWQHLCESLWMFESFSIEKIGYDSEKNAVLSCDWKTADGEKYVLAIYKKRSSL